MQSDLTKKIFFYFTVLLVLVVSLFLRFQGIYDVGLEGHDTFQYYFFTETVSGEKPYLLFYRPFLYLLHQLSFSIFGITDFAPRFVMLTLDSLNIILSGILAYKMSKSRSVVFSTIILYGLSTYTLRFIPTTYIHYASGLLLTAYLITVFLYLTSKNNKLKLLFASGFLISLNAHTHEELMLLIAHIFFVISIHRLINPWKFSGIIFKFKEFYKDYVIAGLGCFVPIVFWLLYFGIDTVFSFFELNMRLHTSQGLHSPFQIVRSGYKLLQSNFQPSIIFFFLFALISAPIALRVKDKSKTYLNILLMASAPIIYIIIFGLKIGRDDLTRLFSPFSASVIAISLSALYFYLKNIISLRKSASVILIIFSISSIHLQQPWGYAKKKTAPNRVLFNKLKELNISPNTKLLLSIGVEGRGLMWGNSPAYGLMGKMYFGDNAVSIYNLYNKKEKNLIDIVKKYNIQYVLISTNTTYKRLKEKDYFLEMYGFDLSKLNNKQKKDEFSFLMKESLNKKDYTNLDAYLLKKNVSQMGIKLFEIENLGSVYKIEQSKL